MNAAVFPEPVSATPMTSRPARPIGMAAIWMGDGFLYPTLSMACGNKCGGRECGGGGGGYGAPTPNKVMKGGGNRGNGCMHA